MAKSKRIPNNRENERSAREAHTLNELKTIEVSNLTTANLVTDDTERDVIVTRCGDLVYTGSVS